MISPFAGDLNVPFIAALQQAALNITLTPGTSDNARSRRAAGFSLFWIQSGNAVACEAHKASEDLFVIATWFIGICHA